MPDAEEVESDEERALNSSLQEEAENALNLPIASTRGRWLEGGFGDVSWTKISYFLFDTVLCMYLLPSLGYILPIVSSINIPSA